MFHYCSSTFLYILFCYVICIILIYNLFLLDPKTAVKLKEINGDPNSTYINANYIRVGQTLIFASIASILPAGFSFFSLFLSIYYIH